jgi:RIO-like serine/threonine protein kinase
MNNHDLDVLRALARLSRMRKAVDGDALALRSGGSLEAVRDSLGRLAQASLVTESANGSGPRLTMAGLALAVASAGSATSRAPRARTKAPSAPRRRAA